jgi:DNA polymerase-3 subunit gamma/tau
MASQSLYRKWRSQKFDEMVGQRQIIETLKNALTTNTLRHAYLFTGPRGTGKTTTARLLAKTVNCANPRDGEPCNECQQCREITAGTSFNVIEIDAASNRGIDNIRELREKVMMPPTTGKYKIYILDEAHMLTTEAFNALLKTLEEPPSYAIFVLATTDVHKMLPTVISRCQRFDFKRIATRQIIDHLLYVAKEEKIELEPAAAALIARTAAGGMRDALSLLDQASAYSGDVVSLAQVQAMLGVADPRAVSKLIAYIAGLDSPALLYLIHELSEAGADLRQLNAQIVEFWRALLLAKAGADIAAILDLTEEEAGEVQELTPAFTLEELIECARIFAQNELVQKNQGTPQLGLELASLECIELHRRVQSGQPAIRQPDLAPGQVLSQPPNMRSASARQSLDAASSLQQTISSRPGGSEAPPVKLVSARNEASAQEVSVPLAASHQPHSVLALQQVVAAWENVKRRAAQRSGLLAAYLKHWQVVDVEESPEGTVICIQAANQRHFENIRANDRTKDVEWALSTEFNQPCKVRLVPPGKLPPSSTSLYSRGTVASQPSAYRESAQTTVLPSFADAPDSAVLPSAYASAVSDLPGVGMPEDLARPREVRENKKVILSPEEAQQKAKNDPVVQEVIRMFGATIGDVRPK